MKRFGLSLLALLVISAVAASAIADGMIVPIRPEIRVSGHWAVNYHHVDMVIRDQVASVSIDQEFVNTGGGMIEVEYMFPVPPDAAIDSMTLTVNGKEFAAKLYKADEARKIYEDIVRSKKDPALLEYINFGLYRTKAFPLEPGKPAKILITYKSLCKKNGSLVEVWYPLNTEKFSAKPINDVEVKVDLKANADITAVYSPTHEIITKRTDARHVLVTYAVKNATPSTDFQVFYKAADEDIGATLLTHQPALVRDGFFMMLASPNMRLKQAVAPKDVVIVMDRSGSMSGEKIRQAREAVKYLLQNLNKEDRFNVISFSDSVEPLADGLQDATPKRVDKMIDEVERVEASGGTNIFEALQTALGQWSARSDRREGRPRYLLFMTDGLPTVGKTQEKEILSVLGDSKEGCPRMFVFGVGYDVNVRLLDKLAEDSRGKSDYVKPKEAIETKISALYNKIRNPVLTNVTMEIKGVKMRDVYPHHLGDLFEGDQLVAVGRYRVEDNDRMERDRTVERALSTQLVIKGTYEGKEKVFEYPVEIEARAHSATFGFVEKLWAMRRVGFLMEQIQLHGDSSEIRDELIGLSRDYGILTPYTSFLADEGTRIQGPTPLLREGAEKKLDEMRRDMSKSGAAGVMAGKSRGELSDANRPAAPAAGPGGDYGAVVHGAKDKEAFEQDAKEVLSTVRQSADQPVYKKGQVWMTPEAAKLDMQKDADKIKTIERYSDEYFELVRKNTPAENQLLSMQKESEQLLLVLRGQAYLIK